jgi:hypothetical protein
MMPLTRAAAAALSLLLNVVCLAQEVTMPNTGYSVQMPEPAECRAESLDTVVGKQDMHVCAYFDEREGVGYSIQYIPSRLIRRRMSRMTCLRALERV